MGASLKHFLEHAASEHLTRFDAWFPGCFDWRRLCADLPGMAHAIGHELPAGSGDEHEFENMARAVFKAAHLFTLVVLSAAADGTTDPATVLERLTTSPDDDEEDEFGSLATESLTAVEESLAGESAPAGESVERATRLVDVVWPAVEHVLAADEGRLFERAGAAGGVLWSVARVGAILAAFRWMAAERCRAGWPELPLPD